MNSFSGRAVVFYNVENLFDTVNHPQKADDDFTPKGSRLWTPERYHTKINRIADVLSLFNHLPAMVGFAEVENRDVLEDLIRGPILQKVDYGIAHFESPDRRGIDCALLYDRSIFDVISSKKMPIKPSKSGGYAEFLTRDILHVFGELKESATGNNASTVPLHIFVNHWSSRREGVEETRHKRLLAASVLRTEIDTILDENHLANIIVMGDFNDHPDDLSLETILGAVPAQVLDDNLESGKRSLVNLLYEEHQAGEGTSVHRREWAVLDQIIVSQALYNEHAGLGLLDQNAEILKLDKLLYTYKDGGQKPNATYGGRKYHGGYSDHLPVYIGLK